MSGYVFTLGGGVVS
jgi:hypothetical protein